MARLTQSNLLNQYVGKNVMNYLTNNSLSWKQGLLTLLLYDT